MNKLTKIIDTNNNPMQQWTKIDLINIAIGKNKIHSTWDNNSLTNFEVNSHVSILTMTWIKFVHHSGHYSNIIHYEYRRINESSNMTIYSNDIVKLIRPKGLINVHKALKYGIWTSINVKNVDLYESWEMAK